MKNINTIPQQRLDRNDFDYLAQYARTESAESLRDAVGAAVIAGFAVEVLDKMTRRGEIVIRNGFALAWNSNTLKNENNTDGALIKLETPNTEYWIEVEVKFLPSDPDTVAVWDPTVQNVTGPNGRETSVPNVPTRLVPTFRIVTPIRSNPALRGDPTYSPVGFSAANGGTIPICVLRTNSAGEISLGSGANDKLPTGDPAGNDLIDVNGTVYVAHVKPNVGGPGIVFTSDRRPLFGLHRPYSFLYPQSADDFSDVGVSNVKSAFDAVCTSLAQMKWGVLGNIAGYTATVSDYDPDNLVVTVTSTQVPADSGEVDGSVLTITSANSAARGRRFLVLSQRYDTATATWICRVANLGNADHFGDPVAGDSVFFVVPQTDKDWFDLVQTSTSFRGVEALDTEVYNARSIVEIPAIAAKNTLRERLAAMRLGITFGQSNDRPADVMLGGAVSAAAWLTQLFETGLKGGYKSTGKAVIRYGLYNVTAAGSFVADGVADALFVGEGGDTHSSSETTAEMPTIQGNVFLNDSRRLIFENIRFVSASGVGFGIADSDEITFRNCRFESLAGNAATAIALNGDTRRIRFEGCSFFYSGEGYPAVFIGNGNDIVFSDCFFGRTVSGASDGAGTEVVRATDLSECKFINCRAAIHGDEANFFRGTSTIYDLTLDNCGLKFEGEANATRVVAHLSGQGARVKLQSNMLNTDAGGIDSYGLAYVSADTGVFREISAADNICYLCDFVLELAGNLAVLDVSLTDNILRTPSRGISLSAGGVLTATISDEIRNVKIADNNIYSRNSVSGIASMQIGGVISGLDIVNNNAFAEFTASGSLAHLGCVFVDSETKIRDLNIAENQINYYQTGVLVYVGTEGVRRARVAGNSVRLKGSNTGYGISVSRSANVGEAIIDLGISDNQITAISGSASNKYGIHILDVGDLAVVDCKVENNQIYNMDLFSIQAAVHLANGLSVCGNKIFNSGPLTVELTSESGECVVTVDRNKLWNCTSIASAVIPVTRPFSLAVYGGHKDAIAPGDEVASRAGTYSISGNCLYKCEAGILASYMHDCDVLGNRVYKPTIITFANFAALAVGAFNYGQEPADPHLDTQRISVERNKIRLSATAARGIWTVALNGKTNDNRVVFGNTGLAQRGIVCDGKTGSFYTVAGNEILNVQVGVLAGDYVTVDSHVFATLKVSDNVVAGVYGESGNRGYGLLLSGYIVKANDNVVFSMGTYCAAIATFEDGVNPYSSLGTYIDYYPRLVCQNNVISDVKANGVGIYAPASKDFNIDGNNVKGTAGIAFVLFDGSLYTDFQKITDGNLSGNFACETEYGFLLTNAQNVSAVGNTSKGMIEANAVVKGGVSNLGLGFGWGGAPPADTYTTYNSWIP